MVLRSLKWNLLSKIDIGRTQRSPRGLVHLTETHRVSDKVMGPGSPSQMPFFPGGLSPIHPNVYARSLLPRLAGKSRAWSRPPPTPCPEGPWSVGGRLSGAWGEASPGWEAQNRPSLLASFSCRNSFVGGWNPCRRVCLLESWVLTSSCSVSELLSGRTERRVGHLH